MGRMRITKWILANLVFPVVVGVVVTNWDMVQNKITAFVVALIITALICDFVLLYPRISMYIKNRVKKTDPKSVSLSSNPIIDNKISLKLCTEVYIFVRRIEIGTRDRWLIIHSDSFSLDAGKCKEIEFVKLHETLEYFSLVETHEQNASSFQRFRPAVHPFDVHIAFRFSKNGADQDRSWRAIVDYRESDQISVEIEDVKQKTPSHSLPNPTI
jgi:hypothetical protein